MPRGEDGYATPVAMIIGLALSLVTAATISRSLAEFRLADQQWDKTNTELELASAHNAAALVIAAANRPPPYRWSQSVFGEPINMIAEPEGSKLSLKVAAEGLNEEAMAAFQVADPDGLNARLAEPHDPRVLHWISEDDSAPRWRSCAASYVSRYGVAAALSPRSYSEPGSGGTGAVLAGQVWRLVATKADGWRDERLVRFTGDQAAPVATIARRIQKIKGGALPCETLLG